ncbi:MAG: Panacea domain-containing protein, partial [Chloroflexota bacterium]
LEDKPDILSQETRKRIFQQLHSDGQDCGDLLSEAVEHFGSYTPNLFSGFSRFDVYKFFQAIKFICYKDQVFKTKLMKLLFYADFKHYKENSVSITGARYAHAPHGPVPDKFETWMAALTDWEKEITSEEKVIGEYVGDVYSSNEPDWSVFSTSELAALALVKDKFQWYSAKQIRKFSHLEKGYQDTKEGELISYQYAQYIKI